jgi:hypothetical protein
VEDNSHYDLCEQTHCEGYTPNIRLTSASIYVVGRAGQASPEQKG